MIDIDDIRDSLQDQIVAGGKELAKIKGEMKRLRAAHHRYLDLMERAKRTEERLLATAYVLYEDRYSDVESIKEFLAERGVHVEPITRQKHNLWMAMREIVRQVPQIQVVELELLLRRLNRKVSRAAIESALETHKDVFHISRKGRQKFVALKQATG
jgi:hypothetical protein